MPPTPRLLARDKRSTLTLCCLLTLSATATPPPSSMTIVARTHPLLQRQRTRRPAKEEGSARASSFLYVVRDAKNPRSWFSASRCSCVLVIEGNATGGRAFCTYSNADNIALYSADRIIVGVGPRGSIISASSRIFPTSATDTIRVRVRRTGRRRNRVQDCGRLLDGRSTKAHQTAGQASWSQSHALQRRRARTCLRQRRVQSARV